MKAKKNIMERVAQTLLERFGEQLQEAVGDGDFELVDANNFGHLEIGNTYEISAGSDNMLSEFIGWSSESEDPDGVELQFRDVKDGFEWNAYFSRSNDAYAVGSSADALYVKEV